MIRLLELRNFSGPLFPTAEGFRNASDGTAATVSISSVPCEVEVVDAGSLPASGVGTGWAGAGQSLTCSTVSPPMPDAAPPPRGKEANLFHASGKVMFSVTLMLMIFFSSCHFSHLLE